ncbi:MAG: small multi-drug export protein [Oscillospiraceae bacterium]|nr:small multi-drug export protein [Oscillospiraceae bacterium]
MGDPAHSYAPGRGAAPCDPHGRLHGSHRYPVGPCQRRGQPDPRALIIAFARVVLDWLKKHLTVMRRFVAWLEKKGTGPKADRVRRYEFWGLLILVAIPLPGTGAWTGALVSALLDIRMKRALPPIVAGVAVAAVIVSLATAGFIRII